MRKVLIAGGGGFLGIALAKALIKKGFTVSIFDKREKINCPGAILIKGDVTSNKSLELAVKGTNIVYNLASLLPCSRAGNMFWKVNVNGTENLLQACIKNKVKKVIHISSSVVYGALKEKMPDENTIAKPIGDYGKSKLAAENICKKYQDRLKITIIRPRFIIGPGRLGLLTILFDWISKNKRIYLIGSGKNRFQMISVNDLVDACILCIGKGDGETFNIGTDKVPTIRELIRELISHAKSKSKIIPIPAKLAQISLILLDKLRLTPLGTEHYFVADKEYVLNTNRAKRILGWQPKEDQKELMNQAYDYYKDNKKKLSFELESDAPKEGILKLLKFFS